MSLPPRNRTPLWHLISLLPITTNIEDRLLPVRTSRISSIFVQRQSERRIRGLVVVMLLHDCSFAPFGTVGERWIGEPVARGVVDWLGETLKRCFLSTRRVSGYGHWRVRKGFVHHPNILRRTSRLSYRTRFHTSADDPRQRSCSSHLSTVAWPLYGQFLCRKGWHSRLRLWDSCCRYL